MTTNGKRRPPRPAIELVAPAASPQQAAAIVAALERFLHDTAPVIASHDEPESPWARAAIAEGVGLEAPTPWGDPEPWGFEAGGGRRVRREADTTSPSPPNGGGAWR